jgi:hypothetical protein
MCKNRGLYSSGSSHGQAADASLMAMTFKEFKEVGELRVGILMSMKCTYIYRARGHIQSLS